MWHKKYEDLPSIWRIFEFEMDSKTRKNQWNFVYIQDLPSIWRIFWKIWEFEMWQIKMEVINNEASEALLNVKFSVIGFIAGLVPIPYAIVNGFSQWILNLIFGAIFSVTAGKLLFPRVSILALFSDFSFTSVGAF